jgi:hypothetical protein
VAFSNNRLARAFRLLAVCVALVASVPQSTAPVIDTIVLVVSRQGQRDDTPPVAPRAVPPTKLVGEPTAPSAPVDPPSKIAKRSPRAPKRPLFLMHHALLC